VVEVNPIPDGSFTYEILEEDCEMVRYQLTAEQAGLEYNWNVSPRPENYPDLTQESIELVYLKNSNNPYRVRVSLFTTNMVGCESDVAEEEISINPRENIGLSFSLDPTITEIPNTTISVTNHSNEGDWIYYWDFGDGFTTTESHPEPHTYTEPGEYMVRVIAEGQYCMEEDSALVIVNQTLPQVDFSFTSIEGCLPLEVTFTNETLYADSTTYFWDFGDGNTSTETNPVHIYDQSGVYTISLQASNELGVVMERQVDIVVDLDQGPLSEFRIRLAQAYLPGQEITIFNQSQRAEFYYWDFGDGTTSTEEEPTHIYNEVGEYDIMLITSNSIGCADTLVLQDTIVVQPAVRDTLTETLCPGENLTLNGTVYDAGNPMGADTLTAAAVTGCDSIVVVMIDFFPVDTNFIVQTLCTGSSLTVNGTIYDEGNPSGFEVVPNGTVNGCDSLISIDLSFQDAVVNDIMETLCPGGSLTVNGTLYDALNPSGADTLINGAASGCDSIITVTLDFFPADTNFIVQTLCTGSSLTVNGTIYDEGNPSGFEVVPDGTINGCDSLISIELTFEDAVVIDIMDTLCP